MKKIPLPALLILATATTAYGQYIDSSHYSKVEQKLVVRSVVKIRDATRRITATGFVAREKSGWKYILTNAHVAKDGHTLELDFYPHRGMDTFAGIELLARDEGRDLALLRVKSCATTGALPLTLRSRWAQGERGFRVGFPNSELKCEEVRFVGTYDWDGNNQYGLKGKFLRMRPGAVGGASGSPIVSNRNGGFYVVGVHRGSSESESDACFEIGDFLKARGYQWIADSKVTEDDALSVLNASLSIVLEELER